MLLCLILAVDSNGVYFGRPIFQPRKPHVPAHHRHLVATPHPLGSGVCAGITPQTFTLAREWLTRKDTRNRQKAQRDHQSGMQRSEIEHKTMTHEQTPEHQIQMQNLEREHAARLRMEEDHSRARTELLQDAVNAPRSDTPSIYR
jgi:hypothetical protein